MRDPPKAPVVADKIADRFTPAAFERQRIEGIQAIGPPIAPVDRRAVRPRGERRDQGSARSSMTCWPTRDGTPSGVYGHGKARLDERSAAVVAGNDAPLIGGRAGASRWNAAMSTAVRGERYRFARQLGVGGSASSDATRRAHARPIRGIADRVRRLLAGGRVRPTDHDLRGPRAERNL